MKIIRVAMLVMALALPVFAGEIPNGVTAAGQIQSGAIAPDSTTEVSVAGEIPNGDTLMILLTLIIR
ncbi:MAG TPA: hypothetical protein VIW80_00735 [Pyrinomonadaceae bacterium]